MDVEVLIVAVVPEALGPFLMTVETVGDQDEEDVENASFSGCNVSSDDR